MLQYGKNGCRRILTKKEKKKKGAGVFEIANFASVLCSNAKLPSVLVPADKSCALSLSFCFCFL